MTTDTLDAEGRVLETRSYEPPDRSQVLRALDGFIGTIMQQPPAYSAIKVGGVPSYKLARQGKAEPLKPRSVTIHSIELTAYEDPFVSLTVRCSKGVYVRTLCADLGESLHASKTDMDRSMICSPSNSSSLVMHSGGQAKIKL